MKRFKRIAGGIIVGLVLLVGIPFLALQLFHLIVILTTPGA